MKASLEIALSAVVVRRSVIYGVLVGSILIAINHGDILLAGDFSRVQWLKVLLTPLVPYMVCTFSSVQATRSAKKGSEPF